MNDEQKRVVKLLREYDGIETGFERKRNELKAAELITHILDEFDRAIAENERIRQTHVTHEAYKMVLDELEQVKKERAEAVQVRHGKWLNFVGDYVTAECSICGELYDPSDYGDKEHFDMFKQLYRFCPTCGAKMDGGVDSD